MDCMRKKKKKTKPSYTVHYMQPTHRQSKPRVNFKVRDHGRPHVWVTLARVPVMPVANSHHPVLDPEMSSRSFSKLVLSWFTLSVSASHCAG